MVVIQALRSIQVCEGGRNVSQICSAFLSQEITVKGIHRLRT